MSEVYKYTKVMASGKSHHETGRKLRPLRSFSCDVYSGYSNIALRRAMKPSPASNSLIACPGMCPSQVERNNDVPLFAVDARNT